MLARQTGSKCFLEYKQSRSQYIKAAESLSKCNQMEKRKEKRDQGMDVTPQRG